MKAYEKAEQEKIKADKKLAKELEQEKNKLKNI